MTVAFLNDTPIENFGLDVRDITGWIDLPASELAMVDVSGVPGMQLVNLPAKMSSREIQLTVMWSVLLSGLADRRVKMRALGFAMQGLVEVVMADDVNRASYCLVRGADGRGLTPQSMLYEGAEWTMRLIAPDPYWYQRQPSGPFVLRSSTREDLALGTAPSRGIVTINGGGSGSGTPGVKLRHRSGQDLGGMSFAGITFGANDTIVYDCEAYRADQYRAATNDWVSVLPKRATGEDFVTFDPLDAPTLELLNGYDGGVRYRKADLV